MTFDCVTQQQEGLRESTQLRLKASVTLANRLTALPTPCHLQACLKHTPARSVLQLQSSFLGSRPGCSQTQQHDTQDAERAQFLI